MSLYRSVHVSMWGDARFRALSDDGKLLWVYLLTGPERTSVPGCIGAGKASLAEGIGWEVSRFEAAFAELEDAGMALADWQARFVWMPRGIRYGKPDSSKNVTGWLRYIDVLPECELKDRAIGTLWMHLVARGESFAQPFLDRFGHGYLRRCHALAKGATGKREDAPSDAPSDGASDAPFLDPGSVASEAGKERNRKGLGSHMSNSAVAEPDLSRDGEEPEEGKRPHLALAPDLPDSKPRFGASELVALWNERAHPGMPRVRDLTETRRRQARSRLREHPDPRWWVEVIDAANASPLCRGEARPAPGAGKPWRCTLDFLLANDTNALKVLEGAYGDDRAAEAQEERRKEYL